MGIVNNRKLELPFNLAEIGNLIGVPSEDLGTLCTAKDNICWWSWHKPVDYPKKGYLTETDWQLSGSGLVAAKVNFEVNPTDDSSISTAIDNVKTNGSRWDYIVPTGDMTKSPYRKWDFDGYVNDAECPFYCGQYPSAIATIEFGAYGADNLKDGNVLVEHLFNIIGNTGIDYTIEGACYAVMYRNGSKCWYFDTNENGTTAMYPIKNSDGSYANYTVELKGTGGTYEILILIGALNHNDWFALPQGVFTVNAQYGGDTSSDSMLTYYIQMTDIGYSSQSSGRTFNLAPVIKCKKVFGTGNNYGTSLYKCWLYIETTSAKNDLQFELTIPESYGDVVNETYTFSDLNELEHIEIPWTEVRSVYMKHNGVIVGDDNGGAINNDD